jgi:RNA-splicing ligase RtcB
MKTITNRIGIDTKVYAETFEQEANNQIEELCNFEPYLNSKIRIMPDAHAGKGCTVGTTMTITDKITPNLVGVDIGCGMNVIRLCESHVDLQRLDEYIKKYIPSGFNVHTEARTYHPFEGLLCRDFVNIERARLSIGTLGGGNHFIEINKSEKTGHLYLVIHTGSRNLGKGVCDYYQKIAMQNHPELNRDLAYLEGSDFENYINDMRFTQTFAVENRSIMAADIMADNNLEIDDCFESIHNYIDFDRMILRKGAVSAELGQDLIIPINMRDGSLLCVGKGNPDWNYSAPHGAGRLMSRSKAKKTLNLDDFSNSMDGIYTTSVCTETLDEAPMAYKPMDEIIRCIADTVEVIDIIKPIYNFKAH